MILMCIVLAGCGFHLRSHKVTLSPALKSPYLATAEPYSRLTHLLTTALRQSGSEPIDTPATASSILAILGESQSQTLLSVSSTQSSRQYRLTLAVHFEVKDRNGVSLTGPLTVSESRTLTMASDQILSISNEANNMYQKMRIAIVHDIMNRLASPAISAMLAGSEARSRRK